MYLSIHPSIYHCQYSLTIHVSIAENKSGENNNTNKLKILIKKLLTYEQRNSPQYLTEAFSLSLFLIEIRKIEVFTSFLQHILYIGFLGCQKK